MDEMLRWKEREGQGGDVQFERGEKKGFRVTNANEIDAYEKGEKVGMKKGKVMELKNKEIAKLKGKPDCKSASSCKPGLHLKLVCKKQSGNCCRQCVPEGFTENGHTRVAED